MRISDWSSDVCSSDLLAAWERTNGVGRLIKKTPADVRPTYSIPEGFTLHHGDFGSGGVIVMVVTMTWHVTSPLYFEAIEAPRREWSVCSPSGKAWTNFAISRPTWRRRRTGWPAHALQTPGSHSLHARATAPWHRD